MASYNGYGKKTSTLDTSHTWWNVKNNSTAVDRLRIYFIEHFSGTSVDQAYAGYVNRTTAAGTAGTSFTPIALDPAEGSSNATFDYAHSAEPTYTSGSKLLSVGGHQRSVFQWYAPPGAELVIPVSNSNGAGFIPGDTCSVTTEMEFCVQWYE
jgi:hypothetical protein